MKSAVVVALLLLFAAPLVAQDRNVTLTIFASRAEMDEDNELEGGFTTEFDESNGLGAAANFGLGRHFSIEAAVFNIRSDASLAFDPAGTFDLGTVDVLPITVGAQFHALGQSRFDPYIGAGGAYVIADDLFSPDLDTAGLGRIELEDSVTYYLNAGIGFQITPGLGLVIDGRWIPFETDSRSSVTGVEQELDLSMRILSAGLRLRF